MITPILLLISLSLVASGPTKPPTSPNIIGGRVARDDEGLFQVFLYIKVPLGTALCGGSIIHKNWVVTAAHCLHLDGIRSIEVVAGTHNRTNIESWNQFKSVKYTYHEDFRIRPTIKNDIGLVKVDGDLLSSEMKGKTAMITVSHDSKVPEELTIAGYGLTKERDHGGQPSEVLKVATEKVANSDVCTSWYGDNFTPDMICMTKGTGVTCNGDSGGPLFASKGSTNTLYGLTSYGSSKGCAAGPSVFTKVSSFTDWIKKTIDNNIGVDLSEVIEEEVAFPQIILPGLSL